MKTISHFGSRLQRGVSLLFSLLALAAISLAAVALIRSVDGGSLIIGNLAFKQDTTRAADRAAELARAWLSTSGQNPNNDGAAGTGYYASAPNDLDPTGRLTTAANQLAVVDWGDPDSCACRADNTCATCTIRPSNEVALNGGSVRMRYLITRLCPNAGAPSGANACAQPPSQSVTSCDDKGAENINRTCVGATTAAKPYYRIIVRTVGGRNTVSFTETIIH